ncbi:MAG: hypothetical protein ACK5P7_01880 [Bdellovibrio sp.]|jgi:hypothetical protein
MTNQMVAKAKRKAAPQVAPVGFENTRIIEGVDFEKDRFSGYVMSREAHGNNKQIWKTTLFRRNLNLEIEKDVQYILVESITLDAEKKQLTVTDEKNQTYLVDRLVDAKTGKLLKPKKIVVYEAFKELAPSKLKLGWGQPSDINNERDG